MEFRKPQAIYLQIADHLCEQVLRKELQPREKIPSVRDLAGTIAVNPNTIIRAYNFLEEQGIIYKERGIGYYVTSDGYSKALQFKRNWLLREQLPHLFKHLALLNVDIKQLTELYTKYLEKQK